MLKDLCDYFHCIAVAFSSTRNEIAIGFEKGIDFYTYLGMERVVRIKNLSLSQNRNIFAYNPVNERSCYWNYGWNNSFI